MAKSGGSICSECGARYADAVDSCARRFDLLLALDPSREEPWGSRHALAFAVFALQHPGWFPAHTGARALELLTRVVERGEHLAFVVRELRTSGRPARSTATPLRSGGSPYPITIVDLADFAADEYAARLDDWCRATLAHLRTGAGSSARR